MFKVIMILISALIVNNAANATNATGIPHQLSGSILITNPGATRTVGQWNIEYNQRFQSFEACESAKQAAISQEIEVSPESLAIHYGLTTGKVNKILHLSCLPLAVF